MASNNNSSYSGFVSPFVMSLFAYHLGHLWLRASRARPANLPSPFQYHLTLELVSLVSPISIFRFLSYSFRRSTLRPRDNSLRRASSRTRTRITPLLTAAVTSVVIILAFSWAIKIIDVVLHDQIVSTILFVNGVTTGNFFFLANASIRADCLDPIVNSCGVINRTAEASLGGLNQSSSFRVYEHETEDPARSKSIAYIGPAFLEAGVHLAAHTYVASTECQVYHPNCFVQNEAIRVCGPANMTPVDVGDWNQLVFTEGFNVTSWQMRLQSFLTFKGNLTAPGIKPPYPLSNAASVNPFTTAQFGCFNDFSDIQYRDANYSFSTPFINWWSCVCQVS